ERTDAVGSETRLEAAEQLALVDREQRQDRERDREDHQRLDDLNPPRLEVVDVGERDHALLTSTVGSVSALAESSAIPVARNAVPSGTPVRTAVRARSLVPFCATS